MTPARPLPLVARARLGAGRGLARQLRLERVAGLSAEAVAAFKKGHPKVSVNGP